MAIFKCKMCGGDLEVTDTKSVIECDYCGTSQTIPAADDEKKVNLFNRANRLRLKNDFDKAEGLYESIVSEFPKEAEAYWGICLCKYGIEYVDDPASGAKIPTCHRTSFKSIFDEENYALALENADVIAKKVYEDEAKAIDVLQKDILQVVNSVEPYDVFICYKETGMDGERTHDSVLAQDIYEELTAKGLKVFFSRITLEDKLGTAYEPYIFAALNSAKVMLSIGTKPEHFNAVWVKNEWSRYLDFMKNDRKRTLIPCYKDMDPYDMPDEFSNLQAQNMGKIGAMQDLIRGILKIVQPAPAATQTVVMNNGTPIEPLLKRANIFLGDEKWDSAIEYGDKILDLDPECADAYLCKLLAELHCKSKAELEHCETAFDDNDNYIKAVRFGSAELATELKQLSTKRAENENNRRMEAIYQDAVQLMESKADSSILEAKAKFEEILGYKDSSEQLEQCCEKIYQVALFYADGCNAELVGKAIDKFNSIKEYKDSVSRIDQCYKRLRDIQKAYENYCERYPLADKKEQIIADYREIQKKYQPFDETSYKIKLIICIIAMIAPWFLIIVSETSGLVIAVISFLVAGLIMASTLGSKSEHKKAFKQYEEKYYECQRSYDCVKDVPEFEYNGDVNAYVLSDEEKQAKKIQRETEIKANQKKAKLKVLIGALIAVVVIIAVIVGIVMISSIIPNSKVMYIAKANVGDTIEYGEYYYENGFSNSIKSIEWQVLSKENGKVLLISKYVLDECTFDENISAYATDAWENSNIRSWLNNDFLNMAFTTEQHYFIADTDIVVGASDKVFLLSYSEAEQYLTSATKACQSTPYVQEMYVNMWWLRDGGTINNSSGEHLSTYANRTAGVRPAIWIDVRA